MSCYRSENRYDRRETERFKPFSYDYLINRDKANLDISCLKDETLEDSAHVSDPDIIAEEIAEDLQSAADQFADIAEDLREWGGWKTVGLFNRQGSGST